ncbi:carboxypeptidase regulatory-like domain-containing protein, partial [Rubrivirga sp.]|uniref:carboxypeptidase regulatory-like domain-containing protein n=1 Tax=Rubrivirga sp. TaxID=1885344 RepID=UPI003C73D4C5
MTRAHIGLCLLAALVAITPSRAQTGEGIVFRGVPANQALAAVADRAGIDVVYSTALVGDRPVWCGGSGWQAEDLLRCITEAVGLDFVRRSTGTYLVTAPVVDRAALGAVSGLVLDADTGEPLVLAHVRLGPSTTVTDGAGRFVVSDVSPGPHVLLASYVGYRPQASRVSVAPGAVVRETVGMRSAVAGVGTVVVRGIETRGSSLELGADNGFEVLPDRVTGQPGGDPGLAEGSPSATSSVDGKALRSLLGIGGRTYLDALSIQGGQTGTHALTLDGAQIYEPLQLGPALGSLSTLAVGGATVRKAGFGARHGSHLSGVLEVHHDLARPRGRA